MQRVVNAGLCLMSAVEISVDHRRFSSSRIVFPSASEILLEILDPMKDTRSRTFFSRIRTPLSLHRYFNRCYYCTIEIRVGYA